MDRELAELLQRRYALPIDHVEPGERGTVADTWVVASGPTRRFVKRIPTSHHSVNIEAGLPVQLALHDAGLREIPRPVAARDGALCVRADGAIVAVYEFVDGRHTRDFSLESLVDLLARVHSTRLELDIRRESFVDGTTDRLESSIGELLASDVEGDDDHWHRAAVVRRLGPLEDELRMDVARYRGLVAEVRGDVDNEWVITHGDAPWNVLVGDGGRIFVVDWDDVLLAPRERDTWFHLLRPGDARRFLARYRVAFPDYEVDRRFFGYYLMRRYAEDLEWIFENLLAPGTQADRERFAGYFHATLDGLRDPIRQLRID